MNGEREAPMATLNAAVRPNPGATESPARAMSTRGGDVWRVLIVDDEANVLAALQRLLRREPYDVVTANSAAEGLRALAVQPAQLVISDERMPEMTGTAFLREVRLRWPDTIRIILSGYSAVNTILAAINEGAVYKFLTKPWNDEELKINIRRALEQFALEAENRRMAREIAGQNAQLSELNAQLAQRADDAAIGLDVAQELLDLADVGVIAIDASGLLIGANRRACEIVATGSECLLGLSAAEALPPELQAAACTALTTPDRVCAGHLSIGAGRFDWRARPVESRRADGNARGSVVTIWEVVA